MSSTSKTAPATEAVDIDLLQMLNGYRVSQLISVAARLRIADRLAEGMSDVTAIAGAVEVHQDGLNRVLRALGACGVFAHVGPQRYALTPLSEPLRSGPRGIRAAAALIAEPWHWESWANMDETIRSGEPSFELITGTSFVDFCDQNEDIAAGYEAAAADLDALTDPIVQAACALERFHKLVVLLPPGSSGHLVVEALRTHPELSVVVCADTRTVGRLRRLVAEAGFEPRCEFHVNAGTVYVPSGGDAYLLRGQAHELDDSEFRHLLARCSDAITPGGRVFIAEMPLGRPNEPSLSKMLDLDSLLFFRGARERSLEDYAQLLEHAGLQLSKIHQPPGPMAVLEAGRGAPCQPRRPTENDKISFVAPPPARIQTLRLAGAFRVARALGVVCELAIADRLAAGPRECADLARETKTHSDSLYRLLRALSGLGIFAELAGCTFAITPRGAVLCAHHPRSLRASALVFAEHWHWRMWGRLEESLRLGEPAYDRLYGRSFHEDCERSEELFVRVALSKACAYSASDQAVIRAYDFGRFGSLLDIACGAGALSALLLREYPQLHIRLYDHDNAVQACRSVLESPDIRDRVRFTAGDYRVFVPRDVDAYVLRGVLHNLDDRGALQVLVNCQQAMGEDAILLVLEMIMPAEGGPFAGKFIDVESLLLNRGRERSENELRSILDLAGFDIRRVIGTDAPLSIFECVPRKASPIYKYQ